MIFPRLAIARSVAVPARLAPRAALSTSVPRLREPTESEQAAKADAYHKHHNHEDLQKETIAHHEKGRRPDKITSSPNDRPTESEDISHATKHPGDPKQLQEETAKKMSGNH